MRMTIYTIGFAQKSAEVFFELIKKNEIEILIDVRLNNNSQLAGFTKVRDLPFLLKEICGCEYKHMLQFAPEKEILDDYKKKKNTWADYTERYNKLINNRAVEKTFAEHFGEYTKVLFLCSESTPECCHRRLLAEYIAKHIDVEIKHL